MKPSVINEAEHKERMARQNAMTEPSIDDPPLVTDFSKTEKEYDMIEKFLYFGDNKEYASYSRSVAKKGDGIKSVDLKNLGAN